jgi:hypothetical protein
MSILTQVKANDAGKLSLPWFPRETPFLQKIGENSANT